MEFTLLGAALVATLAALVTVRWETGRTIPAGCTRIVWDSLIGSAMVGLAVGRLAAMIGQGTNPLGHLGDIILVRGGVDTVAAAAAAIGALGWFARSDLWALLDAAAPSALAGLAGWHAGCLVRGTCLGTRSSVPWALEQDAAGIGRHPVEIYAAVALVAAVVALLWVKTTGRAAPGVISTGALSAAAVVRLVTEPLRLGLGGDLTGWYAAAGAAGVAAVFWRWRAGRPASA